MFAKYKDFIIKTLSKRILRFMDNLKNMQMNLGHSGVANKVE